MALFKISKGLKSKLPTTYVEGYCYFTTDDGKFYIDTSNTAAGRVCLNANLADTAIALTTSAGSTTQPIYFLNGKPVAITGAIANSTTGNAATATALTSNAGSTTLPIYFKNGKPVAITGNIANGTTGNAATATKFNSNRTISLTGHITGSATSNGENGWSIKTTIGQSVVTNDMLAGSIENSKLINSKITIAGNDIGLGGAITAETLTASLGLSNAMHFIGVATVAITDGSTTNPVITNYDFSKKKYGDVIIDKDSAFEYVWTYANKWERLGIDSGYKTVQTAVADSDATTSGNSAVYVKSITQNANGNITVQKATIANLTINNKTYNGSGAIDIGTIGVAYGGTGATTFASGQALIGNGTAAVSTRELLDRTGAYAVVSTSNKLVTERSIYFTLPSINNSHTYTSSTSIYAPNTGGTTGYYLKSAGTNATPVWSAFTALTIKTLNLAGTLVTKATYTPSEAKTLTITGSDLFETYTFTESKTLTTNWQDTGISGADMAEGSYIIQLKTNDTATTGLAHYSEVYTGFLSWDSASTNSTDYDEIVLHKAGHASNGNNIYLRTTRKASSGYLTLQICCNKTCTTASEYTITARRLLT